jgi:putative ATP-dependent endonuclease of the OLD family
MKLSYFSIRDYRSITNATLDTLQNSTTLIGPNNEGKSNILQGLNACLNLLSNQNVLRTFHSASPADSVQIRYDRDIFDWSTDYPVRKQEKNRSGASIFELHFKLSPREQEEFRSETGSKLNEILPIQLSFGPVPFAAFRVVKQGRGGKTLSKKSRIICRFIAQRLDFSYIPAIRAAGASLEIVNDLVARELQKLEKNDVYASLQQKILELQKPLLAQIAENLKNNLKNFLGAQLRDVKLNLVDVKRFSRLGRSCQITIDDGTPTLLERKGDGIQSLAAISLMIGTLQKTGETKDLIVLLEEPESHLHPHAIHQLREVLDKISENNQLVITTHCPLLVNRANIESNLIVSKNKAASAESLTRLRSVLGVRTSDNLQHAALILVCEGSDDEIALRALLSDYSIKLRNAFSKGSLALYTLNGAPKLSYHLSLLKSSICNYFVVLDNDDAGRSARTQAVENLLITQKNTFIMTCPGLKDSEFEDLIDTALYKDHFSSKYGVDITTKPFKEKGKWSQRISAGLTRNAKIWDEAEKISDKLSIAQLISSNPSTAIHPARKTVIEALAEALENSLQELSPNKAL